MSKQRFTIEEKSTLEKSPAVEKVGKTISYNSTFKLEAVRKYKEEGLAPVDIFTEAGIPESIVSRGISNNRLSDWLKKDPLVLMNDKRGIHEGNRGRRPKLTLTDTSKMTIEEEIIFLRARIAYVDKENDFLAEARGIKRVPFRYRPGQNTNS